MLVSLHMPKTAGSSFAASLESYYGSRLLKDYADLPIITPMNVRNKAALQARIDNAEKNFSGVECIHGHFLPVKYQLLSTKKKISFITWLRNPVERLLSHYYFWKRSFDPETALSLHRKVIEEDWSVEHFCLSPELKDLYTQFLFDFPLENFVFIGITEFYQEDFDLFSRIFLNTSMRSESINIGTKGGCYTIDKSFRNEIEKFHSNDMMLYQKALEIRDRNKSRL